MADTRTSQGGQSKDANLGLEGFAAAPPDEGLTLDHLNEAFAQMLGAGLDPYRELPSATEDRPWIESSAEDRGATHESGGEISPRGILEAILFVGSPEGRPITADEVAGLMRGVRPDEIATLVQELNRQYSSNRCPYQIESIGAGYRLTLREEFAPLRDRVHNRSRQVKLSQAAVDVLSIVAYRGPIAADEVSRLRGRASGSVLTHLVRRQLLKVERRTAPRRTALYVVTVRLLDLVGIDSLDELPHDHDAEPT